MTYHYTLYEKDVNNMTMSKKNQTVRDAIVKVIKGKGFTSDAYGNYKNADGDRRFKFNQTSFRFEGRIDTKPVSWMKIMSSYYKNVMIKDGKVTIQK